MRRRALVFAGAGASFAVNAKEFPTTVEFYRKLPEAVRDDQFVELIVRKLPEKFGSGQPDIEKILWCIDEARTFLSAVADRRNAASWLLTEIPLAKALGLNYDVSGFLQIAPHAKRRIESIRDAISAKVYEYYSHEPTAAEIGGNWRELFGVLREKGYWPDIFTTNYDLVVEYASRLVGFPIGYGKSGSVVDVLELDRWKRSVADPNYIPYADGFLTKLHGSVNWERDGERVVFGSTGFKGRHEFHALIYPGFKGTPSQEPFDLLHSYFEAAIREADVIIFIGFAFRDEYINRCLERNIGGKLLYLIDPSDTLTPPSQLAERIKRIPAGFDLEAISQLRSYLQ